MPFPENGHDARPRSVKRRCKRSQDRVALRERHDDDWCCEADARAQSQASTQRAVAVSPGRSARPGARLKLSGGAVCGSTQVANAASS